MKIVTLVENSCSDSRLKEEFGLSLLVKCNSGTILFDMGASGVFADNAAILGEDLHDIECAVVSHAHYDHGGGLPVFLKRNTSAKIYVGACFDGQYWGNVGAKLPPFLQPLLYPLVKQRKALSRYIGIDREVLEEHKDRFINVQGGEEILENVFLLTHIPITTQPAAGNKFLLQMKGEKLEKDTFDHEVIMVVREPDGLVIFTGCGHRHILNMVEAVEEKFKDEPIKGIVGGFHLALRPGKPGLAGTREEVEYIARRFLDARIKKVATGHCTGGEACTVLEGIMKDKYSSLSTGYCCEI